MRATLSSIRGKVAEVEIYIGDPDVPESDRLPEEKFTLHYRQHGMTGKMLQLALTAEKNDRAHEALVDMCIPVFVKWDLKLGPTDEQVDRLNNAETSKERKAIEAEIAETIAEQEPIPLTREDLLDYLPLDVLALILNQVSEARHPNQNGTGKQ